MASMRKLRRRELRWRRYWARTATSLPRNGMRHVSAGRWRSFVALDTERDRRRALAGQRFELAWIDDGAWCCGGDECIGECGDDVEWPDDVFRPVETVTVAGGVL